MEASWSAALLGRFEDQPWLDKAGDRLQGLLQPLLDHPSAPPIKNFLSGTWLGHALHPVLSDLPIGFWAASLVLDLFGASKSAGLMNIAGATASVATAATGVNDWTSMHGRERRLALLHGMLNVGALTLQVASIGARLTLRRGTAVRLSLAGFGISSAAAYLGGELVMGRGQMVNHDAWTAGPQEWTPVGTEASVPEGGTKGVACEGRKVLLYKAKGQIHALEDACTHAGGPLSEGEVKDGVVTCPWHGSRFNLADGSVCGGPATYPQLRLQSRVRAGKVEVRGRQG